MTSISSASAAGALSACVELVLAMPWSARYSSLPSWPSNLFGSSWSFGSRTSLATGVQGDGSWKVVFDKGSPVCDPEKP